MMKAVGTVWTGFIWLRTRISGTHMITTINLWVPHNVGNFLTSSVTTSFSRRTLLHEASY